ncbi:MAG: 2,3-bisphosphoglycerate-independent phosphoglycerate mutase [Elusimicrobiota bacterium]|nr:2,3-bisphosphoglycerate-independent phosphoglycerate mutase [Elusimicrobiota bacterium]
MDQQELIKSIAQKNQQKILLLVIDGLGGISHPETNKTELETANLTNLNNLCKKSLCGLITPISQGIIPGSGPAHLALFGYNPLRYQIGRGVLEALGIGVELTKNDLAVRANFATINYSSGVIVDRRAGRISTDENQKLTKILQEKINTIDNVEVIIRSGKEHRFVVIFRAKSPDALSENITSNDPQKENKPPAKITACSADTKAGETANLINKFLESALEILKAEKKANYILLRGFSKYPDIPQMQDVYKLNPACIATYPMYRGLAQLVGMKILHTGEKLQDELQTLKNNFDSYDFFYLHIKETDALGEDGNFSGKVKKLEEIDKILPEIVELKLDVLIITGDHSTPATLKGHSWHNVPFLLYSKNISYSETLEKFTEKECLKGSLGIFPATSVMPLALANTGKLTKFGA